LVRLVKIAALSAVNAFIASIPSLSYVSWARVYIVNPKKADFGGKDEIDFDYLPNSERKTSIESPKTLYTTDKDPNILTVAVSYDFEMKIAFVNWVMFEAWYATQVGVELSGSIWSARTADPTATAVGGGTISRSASRSYLSSQAEKTASATRIYRRARKNLAYYWALQAINVYAIPLYSTYSMRMQSNIFKRNVEVTDGDSQSKGLPTTDAGSWY